MKVMLAAAFALAALGAPLHDVTPNPSTVTQVAAGAFEEPPVACTFAHPQYSGHCVEQATPAKDQTPVQACRVILSCLNDARCVKTYCQATTIRGGWSLVSPKADDKPKK